MIEDKSVETEYNQKYGNCPEIFTVAQSVLLGLVIGSVAIVMGPWYGAMVATGASLATIVAGIKLENIAEQPAPLRIPARLRQKMFIERSRDLIDR